MVNNLFFLGGQEPLICPWVKRGLMVFFSGGGTIFSKRSLWILEGEFFTEFPLKICHQNGIIFPKDQQKTVKIPHTKK